MKQPGPQRQVGMFSLICGISGESSRDVAGKGERREERAV
jgi:hypothetical protein